jgi:site-specific DNA recombinase
MKAAIYARLSQQRKRKDKDGNDNESTSIDRQVKACRAICKARGWKVAEVYQDVDSGWKRGVVRFDWERLRSDVEAGEVGAVVVFATSRASRRTVDLLNFVELCRDRGVEFVSATEPIDTAGPYGETFLAMLGSVAAMESQNRSDRITGWHEERAVAGKPGGGGHRPFGYRDDRITIDRREARLITKAAERVIAGASLRSIARAWNNDGVVTTAGKPWSVHSLRRLLLSPRIAGLREHQGETVGDAVWPGIIDRATHERVRAILTDPRRGKRSGSSVQSYLLTGGIARCRLCGAGLMARPKADGTRAMVCATDLGGCGKIKIKAEPVEDFVTAALLERLSDPKIVEKLKRDAAIKIDDAAALRQLEADRNALDELVQDRYVHRIIDHGAFLAADRELRERIETVERQFAAADRRVLLAVPDIRERWATSDIGQQRGLLGMFVESVVVGPVAVRGRNRFDPDRVSIRWRT